MPQRQRQGRDGHQRHRRDGQPARSLPTTARSRKPPSTCCRALRGAFSPRLHGRGHALRRPRRRRASARWCSAASSAAGSSPARPPRSTSSARRYIREIEPGEFVAIDEHGLRTERFAKAEPKGCLFEYVYLARPDTTISEQRVFTVRASRSAAAWPGSTRSRPTWSSRCRSRARPPPSATPRRAASRSATVW